MKDIWIDESVNHALWARGKYKIPSRIRVRAVKFDDGAVEVSLPEVEFKSFREELKTIKEAKEPILKREEEGAEEEEGERVAEEVVSEPSEEETAKETPSKEEKLEREEKPAEKEKPKDSKESTGETISTEKARKTGKK
ncbi:MAG TPA: hypothetical protein EYP23_06935 [Thermoplasmata archaeon]|nr:hypothetical protein [Thermoplasmata archaeon]